MIKSEQFKSLYVEKDNIECKTISKGKLPDDLWEAISAFSNADGGLIKLGVNPEGVKVPIELKYIDGLQSDLVSLCLSAFNSKLYPEITVEDDEYINIYIPPVPAAIRPIYSLKRGVPKGGRVRVGSSNIQLDGEWIKRFAIAAKGGAELLTLEGDYKEFYDQSSIDKYLDIVKQKRGEIYLNLLNEEILVKLRALTQEKKITLFGLLAFSNNNGLQELTAPTVDIAITQYSGTSKVNPLDVTEVSIDDKEFYGSAVAQFENALKYIFLKLPVRSRINTDGKRLDYLAIPKVAIREVLANTLAHRDYTTFKGRIQIDVYSDRIEFANPGRSLVPIDALEITHPETRNPLLMSYMRDLNITEHRGRGIRTIKNSLKNAGLAEPKFENKNDWFVVTLYSSAFISQDDQTWLKQFKDYRLNERQLKVLVYMKHNDVSITNSEYRDINHMSNVRDDIRAKKDLAKLATIGLVTKVGENRYRRYRLVS